MVNQAIVVTPEFLHKGAELVKRVLMALVASLFYSLSPANKPVVVKAMMRRFQISDPNVADEGYQDYLTSVDRKPLPSLEGLRNIRRIMGG